MFFPALFAAFCISAALRSRHWRGGFFAIAVGAVIVPIISSIEVFVLSTNPEVPIWGSIELAIATFCGLVAASLGYLVAVFGERNREA